MTTPGQETRSSTGDTNGTVENPRASSITHLVTERAVIVCCGSGGVGKTTVSAAIALQAAMQGRKACVVTIDPARRLANSLGIEALSNTPHLIEGSWPGQLSALMLDPKGTFDDLIGRHAASTEQAQRILDNRIYRNLTSALSGTQEYMAMEKLYELTEEGGFDLVVVDTPPTRNALDFLNAPRRLSRFLEHRLFQLLLVPTKTYLRAVSMATQALLRTLSKVAGADIVADAVAFFQAFEGMEEGFALRAGRVAKLLSEPATAFVLVTSPRKDTVVEAEWFADKLREASLSVEGLVVNRVQPNFETTEELPDAPEGSPLASLIDNVHELQAVSAREATALSQLSERISPSPVVLVPLLDSDVHDISGLTILANHLFPISASQTTPAAPRPARQRPQAPKRPAD